MRQFHEDLRQEREKSDQVSHAIAHSLGKCHEDQLNELEDELLALELAALQEELDAE